MNSIPVTQSAPGIRFTHDPKLEVAYLYLVDRSASGGSHRSVQALHDPNVIFDLDKADRILGIEFLDTRYLRPETLAEAEKPPRRPEEFLDATDRRVLHACLGDRHAQEALYVEYDGMLVEEARKVLGRPLRCPIIRGAGVAWLRRLVRSRAAEIARQGGAR